MEYPLSALNTIHKYFSSTGEKLCTVESCTGGLLSFWLTHLPGSSKYFKGGLVSYRTEVKISQLGLDPKRIQKEGLVTEACAQSMAQGVKNLLKSDWALSTTGIAGPSKGDLGESLGKVAFSFVSNTKSKSLVKHFEGPERKDIRYQSAFFALNFLISGFK